MNSSATIWNFSTAISSGKLWAGRTALSILDQGLVSVSNFLTTILFARWLHPADFGALAIAFSVFLFLSGFQNALILEPMSVLGRRYYSGDLASYICVSVLLHILFASVLSLALLTASILAAGSASLASALLALAYTAPVILLFWHLRRACYVRLAPRLAASGSAAYCAILIIGLVAARHLGWISVTTPFVAMAVSSLGASLVLAWALGINLDKPERLKWLRADFLRDVWKRHWRYGQWIVGAAVFVWIANSAFPILVATFAGLEAAGMYRAAEVLFQPLLQTVAAVTVLLLPWLSTHRAQNSRASLTSFVAAASFLTAVLGLVYVTALAITARNLLDVLYGHQQYYVLLALLPVFGLGFTMRAVNAAGLATAVRAAGVSKAVFLSSALGAAVTLVAGTMLIPAFDLAGAAFTLLLSALAQGLVFLGCFKGMAKDVRTAKATH